MEKPETSALNTQLTFKTDDIAFEAVLTDLFEAMTSEAEDEVLLLTKDWGFMERVLRACTK